MLSIKNSIRDDDLYKVSQLAQGHPVYLVEGFGDLDNSKVDQIVLKLEVNEPRKDVMFAAATMTLVDKNARTVALSNMEVAMVKRWCDGELQLADSVSAISPQGAVEALKADLGRNGTWVKMEVKRLTMLDGALANRLQGDKSDIRLIAKALKSKGGLEKLGEIITADLFIGNSDRFDCIYGGINEPGLPQRLKVIRNLGNVFIACDGNGTGKPIGLDNYDPNNEFRKVTQPIHNINEWPGKLLMPNKNSEREQFLGKIVFDLEMVLGPRNRKTAFGSTNRLGKNRKNRLLKGMKNGANIIRTALRSRRTHPNFPEGMRHRMELLNWL